MQIETGNILDLFSEPMQSFRLLKLYIKNNCKDSYCKILEKGVEYKFYSSSQQQKHISLYGENINICAIVGPNGSNCKLVIAGKGHVYETHDKRIIRICRFIDDSEIAELFKRAQYIVYPYRSATMSGVLSIAYYFNKKIAVFQRKRHVRGTVPMSFR